MADGMVMVVEDDASIRDLVIEVLAQEGFAAVGAGNGDEALRRLRQGEFRPSLILLDLMMPVMDGWQFREQQLRDPALAGIPVVVTSALADDVVDADGFCRKPFDWDALVGAVNRFAAPRS